MGMEVLSDFEAVEPGPGTRTRIQDHQSGPSTSGVNGDVYSVVTTYEHASISLRAQCAGYREERWRNDDEYATESGMRMMVFEVEMMWRGTS
jgi:hypothetical protein